MIYVAGVPFSPYESSQTPDDGKLSGRELKPGVYLLMNLELADFVQRGMDTLIALMEHPDLVSASNSFKSTTEKKFSVSEDSNSVKSKISKSVYIFQKEFATVDPALVDLVGTDEATTCVGISIRNCRTGMISLAHMDFPDIVENGLNQMLSLITDRDPDTLLDVHLVGGFDDISSPHPNLAPKNRKKLEGYSYPLCAKIIETLRIRSENFQIRTLHVLGQNTKFDTEGFACPIFHGFVVDTSNGSITPASFDRKSRCPDEIVRRIRVTASFENPNWSHKLLDTYETNSDKFVIAPCAWTIRQKRIATTLQSLSDTEILLTCSSSPSAEAPDFVDNERRKWGYLIKHPDWRESFPSGQPRIFLRTADGNWVLSLQ